MMNVQQALAALGGTSRQIAFTLLHKGIRGERESMTCCPIANYLQHCGFSNVAVGLTDVDVMSNTEYLPMPVRDFIFDFDRFGYPDLIR
jgi:hypothetical protein